MKKLLSLLSVLTISGTAVPTTIAASPYQKEETINSDINYQQTNNNYSWLDVVYDIFKIGSQKIEEIKNYILENYKIFENIIENLTINDLFQLFKNREQYNDYNLSNKKIDFSLNKINLLTTEWKKIINVNPIEQETDWYCVPAVVQMILNYFNVDINEFSQNRIYHDSGGVGEDGLYVNQNLVNYINNIIEQHGETRGLRYYYHPLESGFGSIQTELLMFEFYVTQSLYWNSPISFSYNLGLELDDQHIILINGIDIDQENPANTLYYYIDSSHGTQETMYGWEIENYCIEGAELIGVGDGFDFENKQIEFSTIYTPEEHKESGQITMEPLNLNLTENTGITSINQLHNFSNFKIEDYKMRAVWNGWVDEQYSTTYNTKQIPLGSTDWILEKKDFWSFWLAQATFLWYWATASFYKVDEYDRNINNFFLQLNFAEKSGTRFSSYQVSLYFNAGTKIIFSF